MARLSYWVRMAAAGGLAVAVGAVGALGIENVAQAQGSGPVPCAGMMGGYGPGMMGPGMMGQGMMGPGMMGGYGQGGAQQAELHLAANDVKTYLERWIATMGNPHLKPGRVTEANADTITAEIVTADKDALVQRFSVNRHTGYWQQVQ